MCDTEVVYFLFNYQIKKKKTVNEIFTTQAFTAAIYFYSISVEKDETELKENTFLSLKRRINYTDGQ